MKRRIWRRDVYSKVFRPPASQEQIPERRIPSTRSYTASIPQHVGGSFTGTKPLQRSRKGPLCQHVLNRIAGPLNQHAEKHCARRSPPRARRSPPRTQRFQAGLGLTNAGLTNSDFALACYLFRAVQPLCAGP